MKHFIFFLMISAMTPGFAAAASCYGPAEMDAEMAVRLHSELMVSTLLCRTSSTGVALPTAYKEFTDRHIEMLRDAEQRLMSWYRKAGAKSAEGKMDRLRTLLGNAYSQEIADKSPTGFCNQYRDHTGTAGNWSADDVRHELKRLAKAYKPHEPLCKKMEVAEAEGDIVQGELTR
ncbi:MAG: hypothetical protein WDO70_05310 [Alphaproteobacteria bacterium]